MDVGSSAASSVNIKVWVRLESQSDDEAIKLMFPVESDVSDVLLRAPTALNVGAFRPSELAACQITGTGELHHLSNRAALASICDRCNSVNVVIRPKASPTAPYVASCAMPTAAGRGTSEASAGRHATRAASPSGPPLSRAKSPAPVPPRQTISPFRRTPSATVPSSSVRQPSPLQRLPSASSRLSGHTSGSVSLRQPSPRPTPAMPSPRQQPATTPEVSAKGRVVSHRQPGAKQPAHAPRKAEAPQSSKLTLADPSGAASATAPPQSHGVCGAFKAQWGNVLCATCKHSRQAHLIREQEHKKQKRLNVHASQSHADPAALPSTSAASSSLPLSTTPSRNRNTPKATYQDTEGLLATPGQTQHGGSTSKGSANLLDPPTVANLSFGSPPEDTAAIRSNLNEAP